MKLNKYQKAWIAKLKSGKTRKCRGTLNNRGGSQCCLQVGVQTCGLEKTPTDIQRYSENLSEHPKTQKALRINSDGTINVSLVKPEWKEFLGDNISLVQLNDYTDYTHKQIGEFIDANREAVLWNLQ